ncbi:MAG: AAA family ATPase, partial [bacterium]|nr:AAA family ATPase [bacterium]
MTIIEFLIGFPFWWLIKIPRLCQKTASHLLKWLEDSLAVNLHFRLLFVPLFQDESLVGRCLSLVFRIVRMIVGLFVLGIIAIEAGALFFVWWLAPLWLFVNNRPAGFLFTTVIFIYYCYFTLSRPKEFIDQTSPVYPPKDYCPPVFFYFLTKVRGDYLLLFDLLAKTEIVRRFFERTGTTSEQWREEIKKLGQNRFIEEKFLETAYQRAKKTNDIIIYPDYFFYALCEKVFSQEEAGPFILKPEEAFGALDWVIAERKTKRSVYFWDPDYKLKILPGVNRSWTARPTPFLDRISIDLTRLAQKGKLPASLVGKEKQIEQAVQVLSRTTKDNVLLLGEAGCGKTTLVYGLAEKIVFGGAAEALRGQRIIALDQTALLAGADTPGEIAKRIGIILDEIKKAGNVILFIDELHNLNSEILLQLEPHLSSTEFQFLGATSYENYHKYVEPYEAFARLFQIVEVPEATREETMKILETLVLPIERKQKAIFT